MQIVTIGIDASAPTQQSRQRKNADLYEAGRQYAKESDRLRRGRKRKAAVRAVATECGVPAEEVRAALAFTSAVDRIAANCRGRSKQLLLSDHSRLPAAVVMRISRIHADRQRFALAQARADRNPFGKPPLGVDPPFDTHNPGEVLNRLGRNTGAIDRVADGLRDTPKPRWPLRC